MRLEMERARGWKWAVGGAFGALCVAGCSDDGAVADTTSAETTVAETSAETTIAETSAETTVAETESDTTSGCALAANTTVVSTDDVGCALLERDTSTCRAAREAAGLSGFWLRFSCRVTLSVETVGGAAVVRATSDNQPDYTSFYFPAANACYAAYPAGHRNPNDLKATTETLNFPRAPTTTETKMGGGIVGMALNGVVIFGNFAGPGDDIFQEALTFDRCGAHPQQAGVYHYHGEPTAISNDDANFIGVMRDGYPVYGRRDGGGALPADLDAYGGHTAATADSEAPTYHYHLNEQVSTATNTFGEHQWFLTTGTYRGTPGACSTCN